MTKRMLIDALHSEETRVVIADDRQILDFDFVSSSKKQLKGNIYLAKITRVEPSLQAAFVEYGGNKQGFLPFSEIHPDYYQIPTSDRQRLMEEAEDETVEEAAENRETNEGGTSEPTDATPTEEPSEQAEAVHPSYLSEPVIEAAPLLEAIEESAVEPQAGSTDAQPMETEAPETANTMVEQATSEPSLESEVKPAEEGMETLQNDEEAIRNRPKRNYAKRYRIQEVIRRGQIVLIQVIKEERGNKGASLTTFLSLAGRYCVLMPNSPKDGGISRKIASPEDRKRLKQMTAEFKFAKGMSVIIRTAGMGRTHAEIKRDYDYLVKLWNNIRELTLQSNAPALIYEESDIIKRSIRDQYTSDIDELIVEGDEGYEAAKAFMQLLLPSHTPKIKSYEGTTPLFYAYNVEDQLLAMHDPIVKLRSGGYIVINPTEALISIDVNSGRATGERNIEETASKTNLEAANEVARQLRLRDLAGLIVIDFIDMLESRNRRNVERALKDALKADRAKIQIGRISPFGLMEMSRQRLRPSISETNMVQCPHCAGRGVIRSNESMSIQIIRALEKEAASGAWSGFRVIAPQTVGLHLLNTKRSILSSLEERHNVNIQILIDAQLSLSDYNLEKMRRSGNPQADTRKPRREPRLADTVTMEPLSPEDITQEPVLESPAFTSDNITEVESDTPRENNRGPRGDRGRRRGRRGGRGGRNNNRRDFNDKTPQAEGAEIIPITNNEPAMPVSESAEAQAPAGARNSRPPREGGRGQKNPRGRRPWRDNNDRGQRTNAEPAVVGESDGNALPAFATEKPVLVETPQPLPPAPVLQSTPRDPNAPSKKGWWQKMIDLED
jgi:ribonuclease E